MYLPFAWIILQAFVVDLYELVAAPGINRGSALALQAPAAPAFHADLRP
jgi:hypothetical protein